MSPHSPLPPPAPLDPPWWARGGHAQTLFAYALRERGEHVADWPGARRLEVPVEGGDRLVAHHVPGTSGVLVLLFHGLGGDTTADYLRRAALVARERGHSVLAVNHRGAAPDAPPARRPYHSGVAGDAAAVIAHARAELPEDRHVAVGYSLSGNVLALLMGRGAAHEQPDAALCVNAPIDLARCAELIQEGWNRLYDLHFVRLLRGLIEDQRRAGYFGPDEHRVPALATLRELDERYTAPRGGFADAADYYARCSSLPHLHRIERPTVLLTAADDPFVDVRSYRAARTSSAVTVHVEPCGGHLGYLSGPATPRGDRWWLDHALGWYLDLLVERIERAPRVAERSSEEVTP